MTVQTARWRNLIARMFPEPPAPAKPVFSQFSVPHQFNPHLRLADGLVAMGATLARIAAFCVIFAFWGVASMLAWSVLANGFWRTLAVVPMLLALPAALVPAMLAIASVERWIWRLRR